MKTTNAIEVNKKIREMIKEKLNMAEGADEIKDEFSFGVANGFDSTSLLKLQIILLALGKSDYGLYMECYRQM